MNSLPTYCSKSGIIGVSVGPGLMQLTRMPFSARAYDAQNVQMMIASFDGPYPPAISSGWVSHHSLAASNPGRVTRGIHLPMFAR